MIVDPDFLTHWRTMMLIDELDGDEMAPLYVIRMWGHCQARRSDTFEMPSAGLKALCRYKGDAIKFESALVSAGFLERQEAYLIVPKWMEHNASLVKNWANGSKGGRPKATQQEPNNNQSETQVEPNNNPGLTQVEPIREEKIREEVNHHQELLVEVEILPPAAPSAAAKTVRGSRLPADWQLPKAWGEWAIGEKQGWSSADVRLCAERFRDYWCALSGQKATKTDWLATWRNWVRNEQGPPARASPTQSRDEGRRQVLEVLTGAGRNEQRIERDITGEAVRLAG